MTREEMINAADFLRKLPVENFYLFCIRNDKIIEKVNMGYDGNEDKVSVDLNRVVKFLLDNNYKKYFVSHNHIDCPSLPSEEDVELTKRLFNKSKKFGIEMVDHIIMSSNNSFSFEKTNFLKCLDKLAS